MRESTKVVLIILGFLVAAYIAFGIWFKFNFNF